MYLTQAGPISSFAVALTIMSAVNAAPTAPGNPREPVGYTPWLYKKLGGKPIPYGCTGYEGDCLVNTGTTDNGYHYITTTPVHGKYSFLQNDADVAKCLVDLHSTQNIRCVSVTGSKCQPLVTTSKIQNIQSINPSGGALGEIIGLKQLNATQSQAIQAAAQSLVGQTVSSSWNDGDAEDSDVITGLSSGDPGAETAYVNFRFYGEGAC